MLSIVIKLLYLLDNFGGSHTRYNKQYLWCFLNACLFPSCHTADDDCSIMVKMFAWLKGSWLVFLVQVLLAMPSHNHFTIYLWGMSFVTFSNTVEFTIKIWHTFPLDYLLVIPQLCTLARWYSHTCTCRLSHTSTKINGLYRYIWSLFKALFRARISFVCINSLVAHIRQYSVLVLQSS